MEKFEGERCRCMLAWSFGANACRMNHLEKLMDLASGSLTLGGREKAIQTCGSWQVLPWEFAFLSLLSFFASSLVLAGPSISY